jgi:hypothetical protein
VIGGCCSEYINNYKSEIKEKKTSALLIYTTGSVISDTSVEHSDQLFATFILVPGMYPSFGKSRPAGKAISSNNIPQLMVYGGRVIHLARRTCFLK